jgi:WD40 repeat protein
MEGASIGTPSYMSPEQARGEKGIDERADVWSLGVMLFELLTGRGLFEAQTAMQMLMAVANQTPPTVRSVEPKAPKLLAQIADRALRTNRDERYLHAGEMAAALEEALRTHMRPPRTGWTVAALLLLPIAVLGIALLERERSRPHDSASPDEAALKLASATRPLLAERAQDAWEAGDLLRAAELAGQAGADPLAVGVRALTAAAGTPRQLWSAPSAAGCAQLAVLPGMVACATFGGVELFASGDGEPLPRISTGPTGWVHAIVAIPDEGVLAFGGDDGTVHVRRPNPAQVLQSLLGLPDGVRSLALSPDASELLVGLRDGSVLRWKRGEVLAPLLFKLRGPITAVAWSRDGLVAASGRDSTRVVRADAPGTPLLEVDRPAAALAFAASWPLYLSAGRDVLGVTPGVPAQLYSGARHDVSSLLVLGNRLVATSIDGAAQSWTTDGAALGALRAFAPGRAVLAPEPSRAGGAPDFYAASGKSVQAWRWKRERFTQPPPELTGEATAFAFTLDGSWCAGLRDGKLACGLPGRIPDAHRHAAATVALEVVKKGEGFVVLSAAQDGSVLLSVPGSGLSTALSRKDRVPVAVALAPDASRLAVSWDDGTLVLFSLEFGKEIETLRDAPALALAFSPDGKQLAAARADKRAVVYLADIGRELQKLEGPDGRVRAVAFSPDGKRLVGGGDDRRLSVWSVLDARLAFTLTGPQASIGAVAWSGDGKSIAALSDDGSARVWAADDARPAVEVRGHFGDARAVGFTADGALLEAGSDGVPRRLELK